MLKKFSKLLLTSLLIILTISSFSICYATNAVTTSEKKENSTATATAETTEETSTEENIHNGDLYIFDNDVVLDKLVDGNVFIFGNNVEITADCQINGNLFIFANALNFNSSYVADSTFVCANSVYYNGTCYNNLYIATNNLETTYDSIVYRDIKVLASNITIKSAVGRDADLLSNTLNLGENDDTAAIYGDLRYSANEEIEIPEKIVSGNITYNKLSNLDNNSTTFIADILINFAIAIVTTIALYIMFGKLAPKFNKKISSVKFSALKLLKAFGIGLATIILTLIFVVLLLGTTVGTKLAFILALLFAVLCLISVPVLTISIANTLKPALKIEKTSIFYLILILVSIILCGITLVPYIGGLLGFIIKVIAIGLLADMYIPHKELTDEEKATIEEAKKQAKEDKEKKKQEKLDEKARKKQAKSEAKETKKNENKDNNK